MSRPSSGNTDSYSVVAKSSISFKSTSPTKEYPKQAPSSIWLGEKTLTAAMARRKESRFAETQDEGRGSQMSSGR